MEGTFVPAVREKIDKDWPGPMCECGANCTVKLPNEAWRYLRGGQSIVAPGHQGDGRIVVKDGFVIEEVELF